MSESGEQISEGSKEATTQLPSAGVGELEGESEERIIVLVLSLTVTYNFGKSFNGFKSVFYLKKQSIRLNNF